jgi:hypothetical protein
MEGAMKRKNEAGQALVFAAVGLAVLMGFAGLGIDMGMLRYQKRLQQTAADAGALAGANNLGKGGVTAGAQNASSLNGFTNGANNATVTVNNPPASGPHAGNANYVEVLVTDVQPTYFMKVLGINSQTVTARAVATNLSGTSTTSGCLYTLGAPSSAIEGVNINGHATLNAITCGIADNGNFSTSGNALTVCAGTFGVAGTSSDTGGAGSTCTNKAVTCSAQAGPCPATGMPAATDPMSYLTPPCNPCTGGASPPNINNTQTLNPGTYTTINIQGNGNVTFSAGTYILTGNGVSCSGTPTIRGTGVTFYFTGTATWNCNGNTNVQLTAPSSGAAYAGILMYQNPADTAGPAIGGNNGSFFDGVLYFPKSQVTFYGNNTSYAAGIVVADALALSGNPTVNLQGSAGLPPGVNIISNATLVE